MGSAPKAIRHRRIAGGLSATALSGLLMTAGTSMTMSQQGRSGSNPPTSIPNELLVKFTAGVSPAHARETIQRAGAQVVGDPVLEGRLFHVRTSDPSSAAAVKATLESATGVEYVEPVQPVSIPPAPK